MTAHMDSNGLRVDVVSDLDMLATHAEAWDVLAARSSQQLPMMSHAWASAWLRHLLKPGEEWRCLLAYDGKNLVGVLPLVVPPAGRCGLRLGPIRLHDSWVSGSADVLLAEGEGAVPALRALLSALDLAVPGYTSLYLSGIREGSPTLPALYATRSERIADDEVHNSACLLPIQGTYESYYQRLGSKHRKNLRQARNRLQQQGDHDSVFLTGKEVSQDTLEAFARIEASGWKGREGTAILNRPGVMAYCADLCRNLAQRGWLEWHFLRVGDRNIAATLAIRCGTNLVMAKVAYDEAFARCSPLWVLLEDTAQRMFNDGNTRQLDLLSNYDYMHGWNFQVVPYHRVWIYPKRPLSLLLSPWRRYRRRKEVVNTTSVVLASPS